MNITLFVLTTELFNSNVMVLPVAAVDPGLTSDRSTFNYTVVSFSRDVDGDDAVDAVEKLTYTAA